MTLKPIFLCDHQSVCEVKLELAQPFWMDFNDNYSISFGKNSIFKTVFWTYAILAIVFYAFSHHCSGF